MEIEANGRKRVAAEHSVPAPPKKQFFTNLTSDNVDIANFHIDTKCKIYKTSRINDINVQISLG